MSYAGGTTHYGFPQIVSSDRPTFADFNEAFRTLDTKLYGLEGDASTTDGRLDTLEDKMGTAEGDITNLKSADIRIEGKADANAEAITLLQGTVGTHTTQIATKADMVAIGDVYLTTQGYTEGDVVMYNGQRYVCVSTYTTGEPFDADKWTAVDVNTELAQINSALSVKSKTVRLTTSSGTASLTDTEFVNATCLLYASLPTAIAFIYTRADGVNHGVKACNIVDFSPVIDGDHDVTVFYI